MLSLLSLSFFLFLSSSTHADDDDDDNDDDAGARLSNFFRFLLLPVRRKSREILPVPIYIGDGRCSVVFNAGDWTLGHSKATIKIGQKNAINEHHRWNDNSKWILRWYIGNWCWYWYGNIDAGAECVTKRGELAFLFSLSLLAVCYQIYMVHFVYVRDLDQYDTATCFLQVFQKYFMWLFLPCGCVSNMHYILIQNSISLAWVCMCVSFWIWQIQSMSGNRPLQPKCFFFLANEISN